MIEKTVQLIGYVPVYELELMTPHEWEQMIKGARHRRLDNLEDMRLQAIMSTHLSNGKKAAGGMKKIDDSLKKERKMINQAETSVDYEKKKDKALNKRIREGQRKAMQEWLDKKKQSS